MYEIIFSQSAEKQLKKLEENVQKRIINALERIRIRPEKYVRKIVNDPGYMLRLGEYRVIMDIDKGDLLILAIKVGHRKEIYN